MTDPKAKWDRIYSGTHASFVQPCFVLSEYRYLLPTIGSAIDIASGRGGNALLLAEAGLQTTAIDISQVANDLLVAAAREHGLSIETITASVEKILGGMNCCYDVIVVSRFLDRQLLQRLASLLNPDGLLFYQTFVKEKTCDGGGPSNPDFLLNANELLCLADDLQVRVFFDLGDLGDCAHGLRNESCVVAQKKAKERAKT